MAKDVACVSCKEVTESILYKKNCEHDFGAPAPNLFPASSATDDPVMPLLPAVTTSTKYVPRGKVER